MPSRGKRVVPCCSVNINCANLDESKNIYGIYRVPLTSTVSNRLE